MDNIDKISLLKELEFYSRLLEKHEALKKAKEARSVADQQPQRDSQLKSKSFYNYQMVKHQANLPSSFNQKYSFKKSSYGIADQSKKIEMYNQKQNFKSKYALTKNKTSESISSPNKVAVNNKSLSNNASIVNKRPISNYKSGPNKVPLVSVNKSGKIAYNTKDFIKEIESVTELLKRKTSRNNDKINSSAKCETITQMSIKNNQNTAFNKVSPVKNMVGISKAKCSVEDLSKVSAQINYANRNYCTNSKIESNNMQQKKFATNKFVYRKSNVKKSPSSCIGIPLMDTKKMDLSKSKAQKFTPRPIMRKVIFSDSKNLFDNKLCVSENTRKIQLKPLSSGVQKLVVKLNTPNRTVSSACNILKKSPLIITSKNKSPLLRIKTCHEVKSGKAIKLKQSNTRYTKINKQLITPNKKTQLYHPTENKYTLRKIKRKVNAYKVINKTLTPNSNETIVSSLSKSVCKKNSSLSIVSDTFLEDLNNSAVDKLEQNLLAISSELTAPLSSEKTNVSNGKIFQPSSTKSSSTLGNTKTPFKKSKTRVSKYKIINSLSHKYSVKNMQPIHVATPIKNEKAVLVKRLFKSKNVIINKNVSPVNYSAKLIKSKYLTLNKRKSPNWQKSSRMSSYPKFKVTNLYSKQKRLRNTSTYHSKTLNRQIGYVPQAYRNKQIYKYISTRKSKRGINNRPIQRPVVYIRGTRYSINSNGKTLRKLPVKGQTVKSFQVINGRKVMRKFENFTKISTPATTNLANRVLHRSINRILTASSKKNLSKINTYCMFYNRFGRCNKGVKCTYIHDPSKIAVCTRFLRGTCKIDGCPFSHEIDPGKMAICSFFLVGECDKENCPYRHEKLSPNATLCKEFVQGYCPNGKECKKAHILICPKYMQGECDKGSSCAFPHPPQKAKKNIQKEAEDEGTKPADVLLEKVLRYFQQGGDSQNKANEKNTTIRLFVPKQRKLEEQPSFIPLNDSPTIMDS